MRERSFGRGRKPTLSARPFSLPNAEKEKASMQRDQKIKEIEAFLSFQTHAQLDQSAILYI